ncbi:Aminopeptidase N [Frankliniella fusca]|uniref:Aminopeptidase n=1 Tax=Frankliniella fusca TaxID=407009 RepID=A0AAE1LRV8_9NEOP|nr:Aminopeptidase N [Frankliniella fusca]
MSSAEAAAATRLLPCLALAVLAAGSPTTAPPAAAPAPAAAKQKECPANLWTVDRVPENFDKEYRLPRNVMPEHYDIRVDINIGDGGKFDFEGHVDILLQATEPTNQIRLHSAELQVEAVQLVEAEGGQAVSVSVESQALVTEQEQLRVELGDKLVPHKKYILKAPFKGKLGDDLHGLYRSSYMDEATNTTRWLATTQFEAIYARKMFPCFDEPDFKATFSIQAGHNGSLTALSNMPAEKTEPLAQRPGFVLTSFPKTVPMSTYLVALVVSDFYVTKAEQAEGKAQVAIWGRRDAAGQMAYAREIAPKALAFFEDYFDIKYPLPKQDMVAIPDFNAGAMENWGLITYREAQLLFDPEASSQTAKSAVANTVVHELAHQWFGNLVTMKWWSDLWLNEGFATYMATLGTANLHPEWQHMEDTAVSQALSMLPLDALESTHPVVQPIEHARQISQSFDTITYRKGAALLRMIHSFLGEKAFRQGVSNYLKEHEYGNAEQDDLWSHLTAEAHKGGVLPPCLSVKRIMDTWTVQSGFPVVTVLRDYDKGTANVSQVRTMPRMPSAAAQQTRFFSSGNKNASGECWYVPLSFTSASDARKAAVGSETRPPQDWLRCQAGVQSVSGLPAQDKWVLFNVNMGGAYRVQYDDRNWELLTAALGDPKERASIGLVGRAQVIDDAFELAQAQRLPYAVPLGLINTLQLEEEYQPWRVALNALSRIDGLLKTDVRYHMFRTWVRGILHDVFEKQSRLRDPVAGFQALKLKNLITSWACKMEVGDCLEQTRELFAQWRASPQPDKSNPIPPDHRALVYCYAIRHGKSQDWHWLWQRYLRSNVASARVTILGALGCSRDLWVLRRYLEWSIDKESGVRLQDSAYVFSAVASSEVGYPIAKDFLYTRTESITKHFGASSTRIGRFVSAVASRVTTPAEYEELVEYTKKSSTFLTHADQAVKQGLENALINVEWKRDHADEMFKTIGTFQFSALSDVE